ncbi:MAG: HD domain-containing phosphohydrolase [Acidobacteriota bacterium]
MSLPRAAPVPVAEANPPTVLVVDDEPWNRMLVEAILEDDGYRIVLAADGAEALERVAGERPDIILLDVMMPGLNGFEVCRQLKASRRTFFIPVIMLTALTEAEHKIRGLEAGADDFLNKPIHRIELLTRLRSLLRIRGLRDELDSTANIMFSMVAALEGKDARTRDHSLKVATLAAETAARRELSAAEKNAVVWGALLKDIGKIGVPESALLKPAAERTDDEQRFFRFHTLYSDQILAPLASLRQARPIVRHHHERLDGSGYPDGLAGAAFSPLIEIVAAANAFEVQRMDEPLAPSKWIAALRDEAAAGRFREDLVEDVLAAAACLPESPPPFADLLPAPTPVSGGCVHVVDARAAQCEFYGKILTAAGYQVEPEVDGAALLDSAQKNLPDLVIVGVRLPGEGSDRAGEEVCRRIKSHPRMRYLPVILVTDEVEATSKERALASGADDFLCVPVNRQELVARVGSLLRLRHFHDDLEERRSVILSLTGVLEAKDPYTNGHSARVGNLSMRLAREMGLGVDFAASLETGGLLHDIGKVAVPEQILNKPGPLSDEEFEIVKAHPVTGWKICRGLRSAHSVLPCIRHHHERYDGGGYPDGLAGDTIPLGARIMGIADVYDALTSARPYRQGMSRQRAYEVLASEHQKGKWDPQVFAAFDTLYRKDLLESRA